MARTPPRCLAEFPFPASGQDPGRRRHVAEAARVGARFLDNIIDVSGFPLARQREQALRSRRIGLGITGLADALAMQGLRYDSEDARQAAVRGAFPAFLADAYLDRPFIRSLPEDIRRGMRASGIRNSHLTAIAPAGTISLLAGNVSSGIEPIFALEGSRRLLDAARLRPGPRRRAEDPLAMQAAPQAAVDGAIAKTVTIADDFPESGVAELFRSAYRYGLKGCTVYRRRARACVISDNVAARGRAVIA